MIYHVVAEENIPDYSAEYTNTQTHTKQSKIKAAIYQIDRNKSLKDQGFNL